jgi:hypothetical protein
VRCTERRQVSRDDGHGPEHDCAELEIAISRSSVGAIPAATRPPAAAIVRPSARSGPSNRPPLAPSACRIASSCCRAIPRARHRLAMFTQTTSSTTAALASSSSRPPREGPVSCSCNDTTLAFRSMFPGRRRPISRWRAFSSEIAYGAETCGLSRAMQTNLNNCPEVCSDGRSPSGVQICGRSAVTVMG